MAADESLKKSVNNELDKLKLNNSVITERLKSFHQVLEKNVAEVKSFNTTRVKMNEIANS